MRKIVPVAMDENKEKITMQPGIGEKMNALDAAAPVGGP